MLQTRSYEMCRSSGNLIQWRKSLFDTILVYNNKNKPMLHYKFGSVYIGILHINTVKHCIRISTQIIKHYFVTIGTLLIA